MLILNVGSKILDFLNVRTQKWVRQNCPWNVIIVLFMYINLVEFSKNIENFLKRCLRRHFECFAPENPKTLQSTPPPSAQNATIEIPLRGGVETPLYLVFGGWKMLRRGLVHPCCQISAYLNYNSNFCKTLLVHWATNGAVLIAHLLSFDFDLSGVIYIHLYYRWLHGK